MLALLAAGITLLGSGRDGVPDVTLALAPFPRAAERGGAREEAPFLRLRAIQGHLVADPALIEDSPWGLLPRKAADGRSPMSAYGGAYDPRDTRPKIAIIVRGLGIGAQATADALSRLPPGITLGFAPFSAGLQSHVDRARGSGHEVLIEIPMEPSDFPESDPGPNLLLVAASVEENLRRLEWALSRATGYAGVMNLFGARFMGEESAVEPVLGRLAQRGLFFVDNGASPASLVLTAARHVKAPLATGTLILDMLPERAAIDARLAELEEVARQEGFAIGVASPYPVTIDRIGEWAGGVSARGFQLVPVSALARVPGA